MLYFIFFVISFLNSLAVTKSCSIFKDSFGATSPKGDIFLENGRALRINCTIQPENLLQFTSRNLTSAQIDFEKLGSTAILRPFIEIIDEITAQLLIINAKPTDSGFYRCFVNLPNDSMVQQINKIEICGNSVKIGFLPLFINNDGFNCVSNNWKNMTCSWVKPENEIPTTYELSYYFPQSRGRSSRTFKCPEYKNETTCFLGSNIKKNKVLYKQSAKFYVFILIGRNALGQRTRRYFVDHFSVVLSSKPANFRITNVAKDSVALKWESSLENELFPPGVNYQLYYQSQWNSSNQWKIIDLTSTALKLDGLIPYTNYEMKIRCKSRKADDTKKWWSDFASIMIKTSSDVPRNPPIVHQGMFEDHWFQKTKRFITIYWIPIPEYQWNGPNFRYEITYWITDGNTKTDLKTIQTKKSLLRISNLEANEAYQFKIQPRNDNGLIPELYSTLYLERRQKKPDLPRDLIVKLLSNGSYELSWKVDQKKINELATMQTIFWCRKNVNNQCGGPLNWNDLSGQARKSFVNLNAEKKEFYKFAVSNNYENISSGLVWDSCSISADGAPKIVQQVEAIPMSGTELKVNWKLDCMQLSNLTKGYFVYYCIPKGQGCLSTARKKFVTGDGTTIRRLQPFVKYRVFVSSVSHNNEESDKSETIIVKMPDGAPSRLDAPKVVNITSRVIKLVWNKPNVSNGIIQHYLLKYNGNILKVKNLQYTLDNAKPYTKYRLSVSACTKATCSVSSRATIIKTKISAPGRMNSPRYEIFNSTHIKLKWEKPSISNGMLDKCELSIARVDRNNKTEEKRKVINGCQSQTFILVDCSTLKNEDGIVYHIRVRAGNKEDGEIFFGQWSDATKINVCVNVDEAVAMGFIIGVTFGATIGFAVLVIISFNVIKWTKQKIYEANQITIQLPKGLGDITNSLDFTKDTKNFSPKETIYDIPALDMFKSRHCSGDSAYSSSSAYESMVGTLPIIHEKIQQNGSFVDFMNEINSEEQRKIITDNSGKNEDLEITENDFEKSNDDALKSKESQEIDQNNSFLNDKSADFAKMDNCAAINPYSKLTQVSKDKEELVNKKVNAADADSGLDSDSSNADQFSRQISHYTRIGLSHSCTDITKARCFNDIKNVSYQIDDKFNVSSENINISNDYTSQPNQMKEAQYSKLGTINLYVPMILFNRDENCEIADMLINKSLINHQNQSLPTDEADVKICKMKSGINKFKNKNDNSLSLEIKALQLETDHVTLRKNNCISHQSACRDSGVSISSPTAEAMVSFKGYVPNTIKPENLMNYNEYKNKENIQEIDKRLKCNGYVELNSELLEFHGGNEGYPDDYKVSTISIQKNVNNVENGYVQLPNATMKTQENSCDGEDIKVISSHSSILI